MRLLSVFQEKKLNFPALHNSRYELWLDIFFNYIIRRLIYFGLRCNRGLPALFVLKFIIF